MFTRLIFRQDLFVAAVEHFAQEHEACREYKSREEARRALYWRRELAQPLRRKKHGDV